jgi:hypothetical protein
LFIQVGHVREEEARSIAGRPTTLSRLGTALVAAFRETGITQLEHSKKGLRLSKGVRLNNTIVDIVNTITQIRITQ